MFTWGGKAKHCWMMSINFVFSKVCWQHLATNVLPLHLKHMFPLLICIFTEGEGDVIESRLPFKIFSTLLTYFNYKDLE